jgi:glucose/arabinose dehydrogenase/azurin
MNGTSPCFHGLSGGPTLFRLSMRTFKLAGLLAVLIASGVCAEPPSKLELRKGDHIALVGGVIGDRFQHDGYFESFVVAKHPDLDLVFRNLAVAGDEVANRHRSENFGSPDDWLKKVQADVILAFFGYNESFKGPAGLGQFKNDLDAYVKHLQQANYSGKGAPRVVLFSPAADEKTPDPNFPDPAGRNAALKDYSRAIGEVAAANNVQYVDLLQPSLDIFAAAAQRGAQLTVNGHYLTAEGDRLLVPAMFKGLFGEAPPDWNLEKLRTAVNEKNAQWHARYRTIDGYNVYGGRSAEAYAPDKPQISNRNPDAPYISNYKVMQEEMAVRDTLTANRDAWVWGIAKGGNPEINDSNLPSVTKVPTNRRGQNADGSYKFLGGEEAISKMKLHSHFKVNLFASEEQFPELANPVQMAWDTKGRLWVAAWPNYPERTPDSPKGDSLLVFEDTDGDGKADKVTHFVDDLNGPTGFQFHKDGVLLVQAPDVWFLRDTDGDGKADTKERVLMGLDSADSHHTANAIAHDPGGAIYLSDGVFHRTQVETAYGDIRSDDGGIHRFEPMTGKFEVYVAYGFANPHGKVFDAWGNDFITDATGNNTYFGPAFSGHIDYPRKHEGLNEFWNRPSRPCPGTGMISSRHFPEEFQGNFLNLNVISFQGIYRVKVTEDGSGLKGETLENIISSTDPNFRPSAVSVGPDGALYFTDWHKPLIGHLQHHLRDPNRDKTHGRIYRLTYEGRPLLKPPQIDGQPVEALLELLKLPEDGTRELAKVELSKHPAPQVAAAVDKWAAGLDGADPGYQHQLAEALWVHQWVNVVSEPLLKRMLRSPDHHARAAATRVLGYWRDRIPDALSLLKRQASDEQPRVRLEAVRVASFFNRLEAVDVALTAAKFPTDYYLDYVIKETLRQLEPVWRQALADGASLGADNPDGLDRLLRGMKSGELLKLQRNAGALVAALRRPELTDAERAGALDALAKLRNTDRLAELITSIGSLEKKDVIAAERLSRLLPLSDGAVLKSRRQKVATLTEGGHPAGVRSTAWAALALADGGFDAIWSQASADPAKLADLLGGVPSLADSDFRAKAYDRAFPLLENLPAGVAGAAADELRAAAIGAVVSMGREPAAVFSALTRLVEQGRFVPAAAQGLLIIPRAAWPKEEAGRAAKGILAWARSVPESERTKPSFIAPVQTASDLAGLLPAPEAAAVRKELRGLGVAVFVVHTVREQMRYDTPRLVVEAGKPFKIILENTDFMPHNLVVVKPGKRAEIGGRTSNMTPDQTDDRGRPYVPRSGDIVAATHLVDGGKSEAIELNAPTAEGDYEYVCTYPGHWTLMWGTLVVTKDVDAYLAAHPVAAPAGEGGAHHHEAE